MVCRGFIFCNRFGNVPNPQSVNRAIKRIIADYNAGEEVEAKKRHRGGGSAAGLFGTSSAAHVLTQGFAKKTTNLRSVQSVMGHKDIQTTMDIMPRRPRRKNRNHLSVWLLHWTFFDNKEGLLLSVLSDSKILPRTAN